jgi:hypothetical protein
MLLTKFSLAGNNYIFSGQGEFGLVGWEKNDNLFYSVETTETKGERGD